ncbi:hypothetical protein PIIN_11580 [Serendipita indica DSM 11827]|uniref:Uncharacterized protein n=1 Tax=Serendipita indica (strain DSM 11827) TaxID=1109443 RepID=G4U210_SERID|nr:hypothetical protein PIIN_11580 [Serendipita indica DSM 11827]
MTPGSRRPTTSCSRPVARLFLADKVPIVQIM